MKIDNGVRVEGIYSMYHLYGNEAPTKCEIVLVKIT